MNLSPRESITALTIHGYPPGLMENNHDHFSKFGKSILMDARQIEKVPSPIPPRSTGCNLVRTAARKDLEILSDFRFLINPVKVIFDPDYTLRLA